MISKYFKDRLLDHLHKYRRDVLGIPTPGLFNYCGEPVEREHILAKEDEWLNIPPTVREQVREFIDHNGIKRHRFFHHLNSSQAFALALFVPFFEGGKEAASALLSALGQPGELVDWEAEAVPSPEEGTNLDARWLRSNGVETFCEVKLTEDEFGKAINDERHRNKLREIYAPRLAPHIEAELLKEDAFFASYQILRNLWHAAGTACGRVLFLYPREHVALTQELNEVLRQVGPELRARIDRVHTEDVLERLKADSACPPPLRDYVADLIYKYVPPTP